MIDSDIEKTIAKTVKAQAKSTERYLGALSEEFTHRLEAMGEGIEIQLKQINRTLDSHGEKLDSHSEKLDSHTEMIGELKVDVQAIKESLKNKVDYKEFAALKTLVNSK